jgi:hypothetical protein
MTQETSRALAAPGALARLTGRMGAERGRVEMKKKTMIRAGLTTINGLTTVNG